MVGLNFIYAQRKSYERNNFMKVFRQVKFDSIGGGRPNIECHVEKRIYFWNENEAEMTMTMITIVSGEESTNAKGACAFWSI